MIMVFLTLSVYYFYFIFLGMDPLVAQSELNGEDSSGSDGASVFSVSIPPTETDRFGFLLGTESTVGSVTQKNE